MLGRNFYFFGDDEAPAPPVHLPIALFVESSSLKRISLSLTRTWLNAAPSSDNSLMQGD
jgi:hypothetical protein